MKKTYTLIAFTAFLVNSYSQKGPNISSEIENSISLNDYNVTIQQRLRTIELNHHEVVFSEKFINSTNGKEYIFTIKSDKNDELYNEFTKINISKSLQKIDYAPFNITTITKNETEKKRVFYNEDLENFFNKIKNQYSQDIYNFMTELPSGKYSYDFKINQRIKDESQKTNLVKQVEKVLAEQNALNDNPFEQPLILVNKKEKFYNQLEELDASIQPTINYLDQKAAKSTYFGYFKNGVVLITY